MKVSLSTLPRITVKEKKRLGLGHGSGRGKTAGRGTKGQKARNKVPIYFEGGAVSLIKRLPFMRGKGRNKVFKKKPIIVNLKVLNLLPKGSIVNIETLIKHRIVDAQDGKVYGVKILGDGELANLLTVALPVSKSARQKIEKAGGKVLV
ncbi:MAG: 50S ribosomal protein L15 [Candidatus Levyibacteriota bacterium]|nr:MAG: 50S ribosomal protein L15 [Candidatus Levybacteria bacterium]